MKKPLRILHLEDDKNDALLVRSTLEDAGLKCRITLVDSKPAFLKSITSGEIDLILADYKLPSFSGQSALKIAREQHADVPFVFVSGSMGEDLAVESIKTGATDYVMKTNLKRLVPSVERAIREVEQRKARELAEASLRESEGQFRSLSEQSPNMIFINSNGRIVYANSQCLAVTGYTLKELYSSRFNFMKLIAPEHHELIKKSFATHLKGKESPQVQYTLVTKRRARKEVILSTKLIRHGAEQAILGIVTDVSEIKQAESQVRRALEWQQSIFEGSRDAVFISDAQSRFVAVNNAACELTGYPREELLWMHIPDLHEESDREAYNKFHRRIMAGETILSEAKIRRKDGTKVEAEFNNTRIVVDGKSYMHTSARDITERNRAQEALRLFRQLIDHSNDGVQVVDPHTLKLIDVNQRCCVDLGYSREELLHMGVGDIDKSITSQRLKHIAEVLAQSKSLTIETTHTRKDGSTYPVEVNLNNVQLEKNYIVCVVRDITERKLALQALERSEEQLRKAQSIAHLGHWEIDLERRIIRGSDEARRIYGAPATPSGLPLDVIQKVSLPQYRPMLDRALESLIADQEAYDVEFEIARLDNGERRYVHSIAESVRDSKGSPVKIVGTIEDITDRKRAEQDLHERETLYRTIFENTGTANVLIEENTVISLANAEFEQLCGFSRQEIEGKMKWTDFVVPEDLQRMMEQHRLRRQNREVALKHYEFRFADRSKNIHDIYLTIDVIPGTRRSIASLLDITERKHAEEAVRASEQIIEGILNAIPVRVFWKDTNLVYLGCNVVFAHDAGFNNPKEVIGKDDYAMGWHHEAELYRDDDRLVIQSGISKLNIEESQTTPEGNTITLLTSKIPLRNSRGEISGVLGTYLDISERKHAEDALRQSEEHFRQLYQLAPIGITNVDGNGKFLRANAALENILGYSEQELRAMRFDQVTHPEDRLGSGDWLKSILTGEKEIVEGEKRYIRKDGSIVWVHLTVSAVKDPHGRFLHTISLIEDITERKRAGEAILASETRYRRLFEAAKDGILIVDAETGRVVDVNPFLLTMLGYSHEQFLGKKVWELGFLKDIIANKVNFAELQQKGYVRYDDKPLETSDGRRKDVEFVSNVYQVNHQKVIQCNIRDITERKQAEEILRDRETRLMESEKRFRAVWENSGDGMRITDNEGTIVSVNDAYCRLMSATKEELEGHSFVTVYESSDEDHRRAIERYQERFISRTVGPVQEAQLKLKGGKILNVETSNAFIEYEGGGPWLLSIFRDVSERKRAAQELTYARNLLTALMDNIPDHIYFKDKESRFLRVSRSQANQFGLRAPEEAIGKTDFDYFSKAHAQKAYNDEQDIIRSGIAKIGLEEKETWPDGRESWVSTTKVPLQDVHGEIIGTFGISRDITDRKQTERELLRFRLGIERSGEIIFITDPNGVIVYVNPAFETTYGFHKEEVLGKTPRILKSGVVSHKQYVQFWDTLLAKEIATIELVNKAKDGRLIDIEATANPILDSNGAIIGFLAVQRDITARKLAQKALAESEERFRGLFENASIGIYRTTPNGEIVLANPALVQMLGYKDLAELKVRNLEKEGFEPTYSRSHFREQIDVVGEVVGLESAWKKRDGTVIFVRESARAVRDTNGNVLYYEGTAEDITERKHAEVALKESEEKYKSLFDQNLAGTYVSDPDGNVLDCNPAYVQMFGFGSREQALATNRITLYVDVKERQRLMDTLRRERKAENMQLRMVKTDGTPMYIIANVIGTFGTTGNLEQITGYYIDDTKRHRLEKELIQSQKLESLGILAGGIAHDFNNILGILMGHVSLLDKIKDDPQLHQSSLDAINKALQRGAGLVRQLLTFARKTETVFQPVFLNDIVKELIRLIRETFPKTIEVVAELEGKLPPIVADGGQIHQILLNLCVNARDAMPAGGRLRIGTAVVEGDVVRKRFPTALAERYISLEVRDSGTGMDEVTKTRIFEPFFTTKEAGKGTGLGLAVVFGVVQSHEGFIDVESEPRWGTAFRVYFPLKEQQSSPSDRQKIESERLLNGTETILIVEDEPLLFETSRIILVKYGYKVLYAKDGMEALDVYKEHAGEIGLVVTDIDLPRLNGEKLIKALLEIRPKLKIMFVSGYLEPDMKSNILRGGAKAFLQKPFESLEMVKKVREILDLKS